MFIENHFQIYDGYILFHEFSVEVRKYRDNRRYTMCLVDNMANVCLVLNKKRHDVFFGAIHREPISGHCVKADIYTRLPRNIDEEFPETFMVNSDLYVMPTVARASEIFGN